MRAIVAENRRTSDIGAIRTRSRWSQGDEPCRGHGPGQVEESCRRRWSAASSEGKGAGKSRSRISRRRGLLRTWDDHPVDGRSCDTTNPAIVRGLSCIGSIGRAYRRTISSGRQLRWRCVVEADDAADRSADISATEIHRAGDGGCTQVAISAAVCLSACDSTKLDCRRAWSSDHSFGARSFRFDPTTAERGQSQRTLQPRAS